MSRPWSSGRLMRPAIAAGLFACFGLACTSVIDSPCCPRGIDGKCAVLQPAPVGASNRRVIQFSSPECDQQICVTELELVDGGPPQGYCSMPCGAMNSCPTSSVGAMRCDSTVPASDGGAVSVCLRPPPGKQ